MMNVLEVEKIEKRFKPSLFEKEKLVLKQVSFSVKKGSATGFLGANGAGKTTSLKAILGFMKLNSGSIRYFGNESLTESVKARIGFLPERPYFYEYLTGREFLLFFSQLSYQKWSKKEHLNHVDTLLERVNLAHASGQKLREFSKGMLQRIGVAQAIIHEPEFVILDEPMSGLDPDGRAEVAKIIQEMHAKGTTVFFSSHLLSDVEHLCDRVVVLNKGELLFEGETKELLQKAPKTGASLEDAFLSLIKKGAK